MDFWTQLEAVRARHNVLEHPFYQRWSAGELTRHELSVYAGEYRHAVRALAEASARAAAAAPAEVRAELAEHAREEASHIALWEAFAGALDADLQRPAAPESVACGEAWAGAPDRPLLHSLVAMYAIESGQPEISAVKHAGLLEHYGLADGPGAEYFALHAELDKEHADRERALIEPHLADADVDALLAEAERVLAANWQLLDGVERLNGRAGS